LFCNSNFSDVAKANFFSLIFNTTPDFSALDVRTPENKKTTEVSDVFLALLALDDHVAGASGCVSGQSAI